MLARVTRTDASEHPMALDALSRLAGSPGWADLAAVLRLTEPLGLVEAELLAGRRP